MSLKRLSLLLVLQVLCTFLPGTHARGETAEILSKLELKASVPRKTGTTKWVIGYSLTNLGTAPVKFATYSCSIWDNWQTDSRAIFVPIGGCRANILVSHVLKADEQLTGELGLESSLNLKPGKHKLHLRFTPFDSDRSTKLETKPLFSNEVWADF